MKVSHAFIGFLRKAAAFNAGAQVTPACILWPDKDKQWLNAVSSLRQDLPELLSLGEYVPGTGAGPAIWLKCAMANALEEYKLPGGSIPVLYLPGVSRSDLRAIESCPRDLQPLAELQYRGVFWSQGNGRDWTVNAFLTSKKGGLGLDVAQDHATQEALALVLQAGVLMDMGLESIQGRVVNAEWLHSLLAPNPTRDLLMWMPWGEQHGKSGITFVSAICLLHPPQLEGPLGSWLSNAQSCTPRTPVSVSARPSRALATWRHVRQQVGWHHPGPGQPCNRAIAQSRKGAARRGGRTATVRRVLSFCVIEYKSEYVSHRLPIN